MDVYRRTGRKKWYGRTTGLVSDEIKIALFEDQKLSRRAIDKLDHLLDLLRIGSVVLPENVPPILKRPFIAALERANHPQLALFRPVRTLLQEVAEYVAALRAIGNTEKHVQFQRSSVVSLISRLSTSKTAVMTDITPASVQQWGQGLLSRGIAASTYNRRITAIGGFINWCDKMGKLNAPINLKGVAKMNEETDRRRVRRALTVPEEKSLLWGCDVDQFPVYLLLLRTGLRKVEASRLKWLNVDFEKREIIVPATSSKARRAETVPLCYELIQVLEALQQWADRRVKVFDLSQFSNDKLREDLKLAGIEERSEDGRVIDFHSFRYTFGMRLAMSGVSVQEHCRLMRHADPKLSLVHYRDIRLMDDARTLDRVFDDKQANRAIGAE